MQYELAKVEEAKETPSVTVLDPAKVPEWKSSPPRLLIMLLGTFFVFGFSVFWVLASARWNEVDPEDPRKLFLQEVVDSVKVRAPWGSRNGHPAESASQWIRNRLGEHRPPTNGPLDQ